MEPSRPLPPAGHMSSHFRGVRSYPILSAEAERALCYRWCDRHDISAAHQLVSSHLRLVLRVAKLYRGYGLPFEDLIGEGHVGMMRAVCRFEPDRGVRFASYALWWVRASIQEYILHNWSAVKIGTTASRMKLLTANFGPFSSSGRRRTVNRHQSIGDTVVQWSCDRFAANSTRPTPKGACPEELTMVSSRGTAPDNQTLALPSSALERDSPH